MLLASDSANLESSAAEKERANSARAPRPAKPAGCASVVPKADDLLAPSVTTSAQIATEEIRVEIFTDHSGRRDKLVLLPLLSKHIKPDTEVTQVPNILSQNQIANLTRS